MFKLIQNEIKKQINTYKSNENRIVSDYEKEQETFKEYNGRQVLELLQNADDEKSTEVFIKLDTKKQTLEISNKGNDCSPFSIGGIQSLMLPNFSPKKRDKNRKSYIGNKGLGFRSIINWSEEITILTNNLKIDFSYEISKNIFKEKTNKSIENIAFLALPKVERIEHNEWTTSIIIKYKQNFLEYIEKQLKNINDEVLLFVNHIEKLTIDINGNQKIIERIKDDGQVSLNNKLWKIFKYNGDTLLPQDNENDEIEHFDLKIAAKENFDISDKYLLYSFFPTEINIDFPFIIHGTFELDSTRNNIIDSKKNRYILDKLVEFIADTAKELTKEKVDYTALEFLTHNSSNERLKRLEFYEQIDKKLDELDIFPCLDNRYRKKDEVSFVSDEFSQFLHDNNFKGIFSNMLISSEKSSINLDDYYIYDEIDLSLIDKISRKIESIDTRVEFICLIDECFEYKNYKFEILTDENNKVILTNEEVYTPLTKDYNFSIPDFVKIKFINNDLYKKLLEKFDITSNEKSRDLQRELKSITNIQSYEPAQVLQKIITSTNKILDDNNSKIDLIKKMVLALYKNFRFLGEKTKIPENTKIQLLDKNKQLQNAKDLFLSSSYPSGKLTEFLFSDIFEDNQFLIDKDFFGFNDKMEEVERFFLWLGINKYTKFEKANYSWNDSYDKFLFQHIDKPSNYSNLSFSMQKISFIDKIQSLDIKKFILWILKDFDIHNELSKTYEVRYIKSGGYVEHYLTSNAPSYILYQLHSTNIFKDYLITNEKLSELVNDIFIDFENKLFKQYNIKKADIESLILKLGAVEKFEDMSIVRIRDILKSLEAKSPKGKQTQTIYKAIRNHKEKLNDITIKLCVKKNNRLKYYSQDKDKIYYASRMKLPKKILQNIPIINIPPKLGKVVDFFGIEDTKNIKITINNYSENQYLTKEFQKFLYQIESFILTIRFDNLNNDEKQKNLNNLKNSQLILCENVLYKIDEEIYQLDYNDYIKDNRKYFIKTNNKNFNEIRKTLDFRETFSDIIGSIFNIVDISKYERLVSDDIVETEEIIKREYGYEALQEAREYLNIADEFLTFWRVFYKLKNKTFNDKYKIDNITQEFDISLDLNDLDYKNLTSDNSCIIIQKLFDEFNINIEDFNQENLYMQIDFTKYHQKNLENHFHNSYDTFEKILYQWCLDNNKKEKFIDLKGRYENSDKKVKNIFFMNYQKIVERFIEDNFDFSLNDKESDIDFNKIYDKNKLQIKLDIEELANDEKSLLYFENGANKINDKFKDNKEQKIEQQNMENDNTVPTRDDNNIIETFSKLNISKGKGNYGTYNPIKDKQQKQKGNKAELCVYNYLVDKYGKDNVKWIAKESDSKHYDIRYKIDNNWIFIDVKTFSNNMFYITKDEKKLADEKKENYEIFLIEISSKDCKNNNIKKIIKYDELKELEFIPNKYEVHYILKNKG